MQHNDDIAFQRAILANPADTTLKLGYADWLQERDDPRAEYIRLQLQIAREETERAARPALGFPMSPVQIERTRQEELRQAEQERMRLVAIGSKCDPGWVGLMTTLAQPFVPITFHHGDPGHPFTEAVGLHGCVVTFAPQYNRADQGSEGSWQTSQCCPASSGDLVRTGLRVRRCTASCANSRPSETRFVPSMC
jgi:uncharacterized protein (TIGR02996 family)